MNYFNRENLFDLSPTFTELAKEILAFVAGWWFDQIRTDGSAQFGDPDYKDMERKGYLC